jgi:hypothetical protein
MKAYGFLLLTVFCGTVLISGCDSGSRSEKTPPASAQTNGSVAKPDANLMKLVGRWERPDGGYVLEVRQVDAGGVAETGYFNPAPIKVAGSRAYTEGGKTKLFVELRDVNYPGCTYKLTYDAATDQLQGEYYQAMQQQTYEVAFVRLPAAKP